MTASWDATDAHTFWLESLTEAQWQNVVQNHLTAYGWAWYHAPDNRPNARGRVQAVRKGFPDLIAVKGTRLLAIELKAKKGRVTPEQLTWLDSLAIAGAESYLWRPGDWNEIETVLRGTGAHP